MAAAVAGWRVRDHNTARHPTSLCTCGRTSARARQAERFATELEGRKKGRENGGEGTRTREREWERVEADGVEKSGVRRGGTTWVSSHYDDDDDDDEDDDDDDD